MAENTTSIILPSEFGQSILLIDEVSVINRGGADTPCC